MQTNKNHVTDEVQISKSHLNHTAKRILGFLFLFSVVILTFMAILAVWDVFTSDVLWKAFSTFVIICGAAVASVVILSNIDLGADSSK